MMTLFDLYILQFVLFFSSFYAISNHLYRRRQVEKLSSLSGSSENWIYFVHVLLQESQKFVVFVGLFHEIDRY